MTQVFGGLKYNYKENSTFLVFELICMARISLINGGELTMAFSLIPILWGLLLLLLFPALQILTARPLPPPPARTPPLSPSPLRWHDFRQREHDWRRST